MIIANVGEDNPLTLEEMVKIAESYQQYQSKKIIVQVYNLNSYHVHSYSTIFCVISVHLMYKRIFADKCMPFAGLNTRY